MTTTPIVIVPVLDFIPQRLVIGDREEFVTKMTQYMTKLEAWAPSVRANSVSQAAFRDDVDLALAALNASIASIGGNHIGAATGLLSPSVNSPAGSEGDFFFVANDGVSVDGTLVPNRTMLRLTAANTPGGGNWAIDSYGTALLRASTIVDNLASTEWNQSLSANQGRILKSLIDTLQTAVTANTGAIAGFTQVGLDNTLTSTDAAKALAAPQGKALKDLIDALQLTVTANTNSIVALSPGANIGPVAGYTTNTTSPTGLEGDYFIVSAPITVDGVSVPADTVLRLNKDGGGTSADWDIDLIQTSLLQGSGGDVTTPQMNAAILVETNARIAALAAEVVARDAAIEAAKRIGVGTRAERHANTNTNIVQWQETDFDGIWWDIIGGAWTKRAVAA